MSDVIDPSEDGWDPDDPARSRRHALWVLGVLACLAIIVGVLMVVLDGGSGGKHHAVNLLPPVETPATTPAAPTTAVTSTTALATTPPETGDAVGTAPGTDAATVPTTAPAGPARTGNPCPSTKSCVVPGDGGALGAANAYRIAHGVPAVTGGVTANAQICAEHRGNGSTCKPHYAWTGLSAQNGAKAVAKIAEFGSDWLLDKTTKTISVGWAYVGGQYQCVLLKAP